MWIAVWLFMAGASASVTVTLPATETEVVFDEDAREAIEQGMSALSGGRFEAAGRSFRALAEAGGGMNARYLESVAWYEGGQLRLAEKAVQQALTLDPEHGPALSLYALILADKGQGADALDVLDRAVGRANATGDGALKARLLVNRGLVHLDAGELSQASTSLSAGLAAAEQIEAESIAAIARENLATLSALAGSPSATPGGDPLSRVSALLRIGDVDAARAAVPKPSETDRRGQVRALLADALVDRSSGDLDAANVKLRTALGLAREGGLVRETSACLAELGTLYSLGGRFDVALQLFQEAVGMVAGTSFRLREVAYRVEAGRVAVRLNDASQARNQLAAARVVAAKTEDPLGLARIDELEGQLAGREDKVSDADAFMLDAITVYSSRGYLADVARVHTARVSLWAGQDEGRTRRATKEALQAFEAVKNPAGPAHVKVALGLGYARRLDLDRALAAFLEAAELGEALGTGRGKQIAAHARENAAQALKALGHTDELADEMAQATELAGVIERQSAFKASEAAYNRGLEAYNEGRYVSANDAFEEAIRGFTKLGEQGYVVTSRRSRGWALRGIALQAPPAQAMPYFEQAEQEALVSADAELRVKARTGAALAAADLGRKDAVKRLSAAAELAESAGMDTEAATAYARVAEVAEGLPVRASAARRAFDLKGGADPEAVYAMYSVAVDAYNAGDAELALALTDEIAPHAGDLSSAVEAVRSAAREP